MTVTVSAIYRGDGSEAFDFARYETHLELVRHRWGRAGLTGLDAFRGSGALGGGTGPVVAIALLHFESSEAAQNALSGEHFAEIAGDIANFTSIAPELQLNTPL